MAIVHITPQFRKEDKHTSQTLTLDGVRFRLDTYTNRADLSWYMDLFDEQGAALLQGIALVAGLDLLYPYRYLDVPAGILFVHSTPLQDPGLDSFDDEDVALLYQEALA